MRRSFYIIFALVVLFAIGILVWLFFFSGKTGGSITNPTNPFPPGEPRKGSLFINKDPDEEPPETEVTPAEKQVLVKIWDKPVAGFGFADRQILEQVASTTISGSTTVPTIQQLRATSSVILFVDRTTGYVYQYDQKTEKISQVSNTLSPGVHDALFFSNGGFVVYRVFDEKKNVVVSTLYRVPSTSLSSSAVPLEKIIDLPNGVVSLATSGSGRQVSFIVKKQEGGAVLYVLSEDTTSPTNPFPQSKWVSVDLPLFEWNLSYGGSILYMTPKASAYVPGYTIESFSGKRIISDKTGLVSIASPDEQTLLSSMWSNSGLVSFLFSKQTRQTQVLPIKTIASKCSFERGFSLALCGVPKSIPYKKQGLPDDWYQGTTLFSDDLYFVSFDGQVSKTLDLEGVSGERIDVIKPSSNQTDSLFLFVNKKDEALWMVKLNLLKSE